MNHIPFSSACNRDSKISVDQTKPYRLKFGKFIGRTVGCLGALVLADRVGCPRFLTNIGSLSASEWSIRKSIDENWEAFVLNGEESMENEFVDVLNGRFLIAQAIAVGLALEADISTAITLKVFKDSNVSNAKGGLCSLDKPWIAVTPEFLQTKSLKEMCFVLSREIWHIKRQRIKESMKSALVPTLMIFDVTGLFLSRSFWLATRLGNFACGGVVSRWVDARAEEEALRYAKRQCGVGGHDTASITCLVAEAVDALFPNKDLDVEKVLAMLAGAERSCWR